MSLISNELLTFSERFIETLQKITQILAAVQGTSLKVRPLKLNNSKNFLLQYNIDSYVVCKNAHVVYKGILFIKLNPVHRLTIVNNHNIYKNCLRSSHIFECCQFNTLVGYVNESLITFCSKTRIILLKKYQHIFFEKDLSVCCKTTQISRLPRRQESISDAW